MFHLDTMNMGHVFRQIYVLKNPLICGMGIGKRNLTISLQTKDLERVSKNWKSVVGSPSVSPFDNPRRKPALVYNIILNAISL